MYVFERVEDKEEIMKRRKEFAGAKATWYRDWTVRQELVECCLRKIEEMAKGEGKTTRKYKDGVVIDGVKWAWKEFKGKVENRGEWKE